jgi:hypothetical protein
VPSRLLEDESALTFTRLKEFALNTDPLFRQLVPAAEELSPTLIAFSNWLRRRRVLRRVGNRDRPSPSGFQGARQFFRDDFPVLLRALDPSCATSTRS